MPNFSTQVHNISVVKALTISLYSYLFPCFFWYIFFSYKLKIFMFFFSSYLSWNYKLRGEKAKAKTNQKKNKKFTHSFDSQQKCFFVSNFSFSIKISRVAHFSSRKRIKRDGCPFGFCSDFCVYNHENVN